MWIMFNRKKKEELIEASPIQKMGEASFPVLPLPFNGTTVFCKVRCLNRVQLRAVGEFNLIDIRTSVEKEEPSLQDMINVINWQEALIKETLISPTFEEIHDKVYGQDNRITELKEKLELIRNKIKEVPANERAPLVKEADSIELYIGSLLPDDFMNAVTTWATGVDRSDIKKLTREMLLEAAILASNGRDNPASHMEGDFLDIHKDEINKTAWIVYNEFQRDKEKEKSGVLKGKKVVRGGPVK